MANNLFAQRLTQLRTEKGIKREDVAAALNCSVSAVGNYENGNRTPDFDGLIKLADLFSTTTDYLLGRTDITTSDKNVEFVCKYTGLSEKAVNVLHLMAKEKTSRLKLEEFLAGKEREKSQIDNDTITDDDKGGSNDYKTKAHSIDIVNYFIEKLYNSYDILDIFDGITRLKYLNGGIADDMDMEDAIIEKDPDLYHFIYQHSILLTGVECRLYLEEKAVSNFRLLVGDFAFDYAPYENEYHRPYSSLRTDQTLEEKVNEMIKFYNYRMEHYDEIEEQLKSASYDESGGSNGNNTEEE